MNRTQYGGVLSFLSLVVSTVFFGLVVFSVQIKNWQELAIGLFFLALAFVLQRLNL